MLNKNKTPNKISGGNDVSPFFNFMKMQYKINTNNETKRFLKKYLVEDKDVDTTGRNPYAIREAWEQIVADLYATGVNEDDIGWYIKQYYSGKYGYKVLFVKTLYWRIVADWVKLLANFRCKIYTDHDNSKLEAHHPGYYFHGYEIQNVHLLVCLCEKCHELFHNGVPPLVVSEENDAVPVMGSNLLFINDNSFEAVVIRQRFLAYQISVLNYYINKKDISI